MSRRSTLNAIENQELFENRLTSTRINLFLGAGFSTRAADRDGNSLPTGSQLAAELLEEFGREDLKALNLAEICTVISLSHRDVFHEYLKRRFTVDQFDERYQCLDQFDIANWFTTNIDNLAYEIFKGSPRHYINDIDKRGPSWRDRRAIDFFALHGCILNDNKPYRFGSLEVAASFGADPDRWWYLQSQLRKNPTLFWGYSLGDAATLEALSKVEESEEELEAWILVYPADDNEAAIKYFRALGLQILVGTTDQMLDYLEGLLPEPSTEGDEQVLAPTLRILPTETIPESGQVFTRPIERFFEGASPTWSDVYSGLIPRISYGRRIENAIAAGDNVIVTGMPACGKTTLLMQLAARVTCDGYKLFLDGPSKEQAELLSRQLRDHAALVFVDNATNDAEALRVLVEQPNIRVVAADRSYYLSVTYHLLPLERCNVIDITDLGRPDLQKIRDSIPVAIRSREFRMPEVSSGMKPSLFEFIEENVATPSLADRFKGAMRDLARDDPDLAEMLLLVSYVHSCRTALSMDMALAYWRGRIAGFRAIYTMMEDAGRLIDEYYGDLAEEPQDYYVARSVMVADAVVDATNREAFREMLLTFHKNVSPSRVCHYEVFRRRAYDATRVAKRAFLNWKEGRDFYETAYRKTRNPYIRQQEALFLSGKKRHTEAFQVIEQAAAEGGSRNWTIRNTYAVILFRRNIKFAHQEPARGSLQESMELLERCYSSDRRKGFHAKTFADHALQFWRAYHDRDGIRYLKLARAWLGEAEEKEPWDKGIARLRGAVENLLQQEKD